MKFLRIPAYLTVPTLCLAIALSVGSSVNADGIASKNKSRIPMQPGLEINQDLLRRAFLLTSAVPSKTERVVMKMRKDQRAAERRVVKVAEVTSEAVMSPTVVVTPGRDRLAVKGPAVPSHCKALHTHERASCIYHAQLKKTVRAQYVSAK